MGKALQDNVLPLITAGTSEYVIVRSENAGADEILASEEMQKYLCQITGVTLPIVTDSTSAGECEIVIGQTGDGVGLFHVGAQLGEGLIEGDAHRDGNAKLPLDALPQGMGDGLAVAEEGGTAGDVEEAFVTAHGLYPIGIGVVDGPRRRRVAEVFAVMRRDGDEIAALGACLDDGLAGGDAEGLGDIVFGEDDAVAGFLAAADGHGVAF